MTDEMEPQTLFAGTPFALTPHGDGQYLLTYRSRPVQFVASQAEAEAIVARGKAKVGEGEWP